MEAKGTIGAILLALLLSFATGCVVAERPHREVVVVESREPGPPPWAPAHGWRRKHEYHYYPTIQVYYYPHVHRYYWLEGGDWRVSARLPAHYVVEQHKRVVIELDDEPHKQHHKIKRDYPPDFFERGKGKGKGKGKDKD